MFPIVETPPTWVTSMPQTQQDLESPASLVTGAAVASSSCIVKGTPISSTSESRPGFVCDVAGCGSRYKYHGDLTRHKHSHNPTVLHSCPASTCDRIGRRGFSRKDKLVDHMLAGHDDDTLFTCPRCLKELPRDLYAIHKTVSEPIHCWRTCPLPRCSFKKNIYGWRSKAIARSNAKALQSHLLEKHDLKARTYYSNLLRQRGWDANTCDYVCPVCPTHIHFSEDGEFEKHFMATHYVGSSCATHTAGSCIEMCYHRNPLIRL